MNFIITKISDEIKFPEDDELLKRFKSEQTPQHKFPFKIFDDDGILYYEGLSKINFTFEPLDDFGKSAGCTEIHYLENNKFERL